MCGITGFTNFHARGDAADLVRRMADKIAHRGPDGEGFFVQPNIALGHRRLSIGAHAGGCIFHQPVRGVRPRAGSPFF